MAKKAWSFDNSRSKNKIIRTAWARGLKVLKPSAEQLAHGLELHGSLFTCDGFGFLPSVWSKKIVALWNEFKNGNVGALEMERRMLVLRGMAAADDADARQEFLTGLRASGLKCSVLTVAEGKSREADIGRMSSAVHLCRVFRHAIMQAGSVAEIREAEKAGKMAIVWSINGPPIVGKLEDPDEEFAWLTVWHNLGVRLMHLTYNRRNFAGDGCAEPTNGGLSDLGVELIKRMNRIGIIVDTPHSGMQTTLDAAKVSTRPIMASHTGARGIFDYIRCKSDEEIKAIAGTGGMLGVYVLPSLLGPGANLNTMLDHLDYIARLVGTDHVGIATDANYSSEWPKGLSRYSPARFSGAWWGNWGREKNRVTAESDEASHGSLAWTNWPLYTVGLIMRGYSDNDIAKILGLNFLRVLKANEPEPRASIYDPLKR
jgi:membrane dipeptidase